MKLVPAAAADTTSTGTAVSTVVRGPMPAGWSYLSIRASVAAFSQWTWCLGGCSGLLTAP